MPPQPLNPQMLRNTPSPLQGNPLESQGIPTSPAMDGGGEFATPEEREELLRKIQEAKSQLNQFDTEGFAYQNETNSAKEEAIKQVFALLEKAGVDLTSPESVSKYIESLKQLNPEIGESVEMALERLFSEEGDSFSGTMGEVPQTEDLTADDLIQKESLPTFE